MAADASAVPVLRLALSLHPDDPAALNALSLALRRLDQWDEARHLAERALTLAPEQAGIRRNLAVACLMTGRLEQAEQLFGQLMAARQGQDYFNRIDILHRLGRPGQAQQVARAAACLWPGEAEAWYRLGFVTEATGLAPLVMTAYRRALAIDPAHDGAAVNLSSAWLTRGNPDPAIRLCREIIARRGDAEPRAFINLGIALSSVARAAEAQAAFDRAEGLLPGDEAPHSALFNRCYLDHLDTDALFAAHRRWNARHAEPLARWTDHANSRDPERRLRIGYVSPDFRGHSCYFFLIPLYESHDPAQVEVFSYADVEQEDGCTAEFRRAGHVWRDLRGLSDEAAAALIRRDSIDILVDLAGHTGHNRLLVFARKPAPVQVTWLGYPTTTGLDAIDWRLSDPWLTPPGSREGFSEGLWRLDRPSHCYRPPAPAPVEGPLPADRAGYITFGSANSFAKISDACLRLWAGVLDAVPGSRLRLKSSILCGPTTGEDLRRRFAAAGGDAGRLDLADGTERRSDHLAQYGAIDIALDSFPYGGMTTTCEALWMGVPVVTLSGDRTASRYATAVLAGLGLEQLVARDPGEFAAIAARLAADRDGLRALRAGLRQRFAASPLRDETGFARAVEAAYRDMWRRWCAGRRM